MATLWGRFMSGLSGFRDGFMYPDSGDDTIQEWPEYQARLQRYAVYESFYYNDAYNELVNNWSRKMKADWGLYQHTRGIYNPTKRLISFYETYVWGGQLDMGAGTLGALPIVTENDKLREAIAQLWQWSNWKIKRNNIPRQGALLGDTFVKIIDDPIKRKVYLKQVHPSKVKELAVDEMGNVKGYVVEYQTKDGDDDRKVLFTELVERDGDKVVTSLYKDGKPYNWGYESSQWSTPYGFVPMVHIQHQDDGLEWGVSELISRLAAIADIDDMASKLNDQIRKMVDPFWFYSGVAAPSSPIQAPHTPQATSRQKSREESKALYAPPGADAKALVAPLDIEATHNTIQGMLEGLESDYPELALHRVRSAASNDLSGRAVRLLRGEAETKAVQKRDIYDDALVRCQQMAIAIGGWRGYFDGFDLSSYEKGDLDHSIGSRAVFAKDPLDDEEIEGERLMNLSKASQAGIPIDIYMKMRGHYSDEQIKEIVESDEYQARLALLQMDLNVDDAN